MIELGHLGRQYNVLGASKVNNLEKNKCGQSSRNPIRLTIILFQDRLWQNSHFCSKEMRLGLDVRVRVRFRVVKVSIIVS